MTNKAQLHGHAGADQEAALARFATGVVCIMGGLEPQRGGRGTAESRPP